MPTTQLKHTDETVARTLPIPSDFLEAEIPRSTLTESKNTAFDLKELIADAVELRKTHKVRIYTKSCDGQDRYLVSIGEIHFKKKYVHRALEGFLEKHPRCAYELVVPKEGWDKAALAAFRFDERIVQAVNKVLRLSPKDSHAIYKKFLENDPDTLWLEPNEKLTPTARIQLFSAVALDLLITVGIVSAVGEHATRHINGPLADSIKAFAKQAELPLQIGTGIVPMPFVLDYLFTKLPAKTQLKFENLGGILSKRNIVMARNADRYASAENPDPVLSSVMGMGHLDGTENILTSELGWKRIPLPKPPEVDYDELPRNPMSPERLKHEIRCDLVRLSSFLVVGSDAPLLPKLAGHDIDAIADGMFKFNMAGAAFCAYSAALNWVLHEKIEGDLEREGLEPDQEGYKARFAERFRELDKKICKTKEHKN